MPPVLVARDSIDAGAHIAQRFGQLRDLPEHPMYALIHARLAMGEPPFAVAKWVEKTVPPEDVFSPACMPLMSLDGRLRRYAALLPATAKVPRSYLDQLTKGLAIDVNVVAELASAIVYQKQRISQFAEGEKSFPLGMTSEQQRRERGVRGQGGRMGAPGLLTRGSHRGERPVRSGGRSEGGRARSLAA